MNRSVVDIEKSLTDTKSKMNSDLQRSLRGLNFGRLYLKNGDLDTALKYVKSYLNVKPNSSEGHKLMAQIYEELGDDETALFNYRKALDLKKGINDSYSSLNNSAVIPSMSNNIQTDTNSNSPLESTPIRNPSREKSPLKSEKKAEPCVVCTGNQSLLAKVVNQNETLLESNKFILDLLRQNTANIADIQQQIVSVNDSLGNLMDSQNVLKDTLYDFMAQEENQAFDDYLLDEKENESLDASELLSSANQSLQWQTGKVPQLPNLDSIKPLSEMFRPPADSWQCNSCYVQNKGQDIQCAACSTPKPGTEAQQAVPEPANTTFSFQLPATTQSLSFNPTFTSSTSSFKFGFNAVESNSNTDSTNIFSNTAFKFGNTSSPQSLGSIAPTFPVLGSQSDKPIGLKTNENIFSTDTNVSPNKNSFQFGFNPNPSFDFKFPTQQTEPLNSPKDTEVVSKDNELNTSLSEVEPSNADNIYFQPVVPLPPKIDVMTGEEDEKVLYVCRARLYRFDNEWKERGVGELKILSGQDSNKIRLLMRRDTIFKVCLNQNISKDMILELKEDQKSFTWSAIDYSEDTPSPQIFLLRLKNPENAQLFLKAFENAKSSLKSLNDSQQSDDTLSGDSHCETAVNQSNTNANHLTPNHSKNSDDDDIEIVYIKTPKDEKILKKVQDLKLPLNFFDYENEKPCPGCRGCPQNENKFFSTPKKASEEESTELSNKAEESLFQSAIEATNVSQSGWNNTSGQLWLTNTPRPIFSSHQNHDDDTVPENPDIYFKPLIPLPDLVEVKTGEEDEEVVYCQRAKLYRYEQQTKEWKERGIGDFKILKHKSKNRYRMVLRREQILKIACNHYITPDIDLNPMNTSETAVCWYAIDYTEGNPNEEQFALKFKNKDILLKFKQVFNECKSNLLNDDINNSGYGEDNENAKNN